jgi:protein-S-isoprenylcysteine O-methyltransferase Ste14
MVMNQPKQMFEIIWIVWLVSWLAASFWSGRAQKRVATKETWTYRAAMMGGGILLAPWPGPSLGEMPIWEIGHAGAFAFAAVMLAGLSLTWWARIYLGPLWSSVIARKGGHKIIDAGPYGFVRHPIYGGLIIALTATAAAEGSVMALLGAALLILGVLLKTRIEERFLMTEFGPDVYGAVGVFRCWFRFGHITASEGMLTITASVGSSAVQGRSIKSAVEASCGRHAWLPSPAVAQV